MKREDRDWKVGKMRDGAREVDNVWLCLLLFMYSKSAHTRTYQNKNQEAIFSKLCAL